MSRWFRHYAGMMRDDKLVRAAMQSKQPVERVVWVWGAILESAAEINDGGKYDLDAAEAAYFLRADVADVEGIVAALDAGGRTANGCVVKWCDRQFQSDRSAERQRRYRDKQKADRDGDGGPDVESVATDGVVAVTAPSLSRHGDAPDTETDTQTEKKVAAQPSSARAAISPPAIPIVLWRGERTSEWFDQIEAECREAAGLESVASPALCDTSPIVTLIDQGFDFARDILPKLRAAKAANKRGRTWAY
jgi:hypothetical protein